MNEKVEVALEVLNTAAIDKELRQAAEKVLREYLESKS